MQGASRGSWVASEKSLAEVLRDPASAAGVIGGELLAVGTVLDDSGPLRRALSDSATPPSTKTGLADRLFSGKLAADSAAVLRAAVEQRWSDPRDLSDAVHSLGVQAVLTGAERDGRLEQVESELFRFERTVAGNPGLRDAFSNRQRSGADKADLASTLLDGKAASETVALVRQAAAHPRGQRFERVLQSYINAAANLRHQLVATVTTARTLSDEHSNRLSAALTAIYGRTVQLNVVVNPAVVGGLRVQIGDEVIDGTIQTRLDEARRAMAG
ncbi:F0F1 ATP synthase subunit delta [Rudaeicoccus suwonensis]|uniref:ATP synthase subunit delta n=1 Tax=Rudaeicoccus suwonensis TaxID=657409 RepID=A0A561DX74_9MICO|nr:F0F1 ATP synthase subunit delta [Rudaeicoccus suwonensis]TWE07975.1 ATP synthase F1 subcomplex delta subunit [Rudaeicoccus suwonensis]